MKNRGPLLTLVVVASLALVLLGINVAGEPPAAPGLTATAAHPGTTAPTATAPAPCHADGGGTVRHRVAPAH